MGREPEAARDDAELQLSSGASEYDGVAWCMVARRRRCRPPQRATPPFKSYSMFIITWFEAVRLRAELARY